MATANTPSENNLETFSLVWLDVSINNSQANVDAQQRLRSWINHLKTFEHDDECEQYIRSLSHLDRIVLIVSDRLGQQLVPRIHQLRQISNIYVYCIDKQTNQQWAKEFTMVRDVIVQLDELVAQIRSDQTKRQHNKVDEPLVFTIFNTNLGQDQSTTGLNGQFVHSQLLIDSLLRMKSNPVDTNELISLCQQEYKGNSDQLAIVREFKEDYSSDRSLWWYTRESFLYQILNKALRVQNVHLLFLFRFLIRDLEKQLEEHRCSFRLTVYRGQLMSNNELEVLKQSVGQLISMNSFLSTSLDRHLSLSFLRESTDLERVLFEIDADPRLDALKPLANITSLSYFPGEDEVLFMLGSIFRLVDIRRDHSGVWIMRLTLCSDHDHNLKEIFDHMKNQGVQGETGLISFGNVLRRMGKFDEAEKYYRRRLDQLPSHDHRSIATCYYSLGSVAEDKGEYDSSLEWLHKSLQIRMRILKSDDPGLAHTHNCMAIVYEEKGDYKRALESYNKALVIFRRAFGKDHPRVAMCFNNMGGVYQEEKKYSDALNHFEKALAIRQKYLPADHPDLGQSHTGIGVVHQVLGHSDLALEHYNLSLKIYKKSLPPQHPHIGMTLFNMGLVHEDKGDLKVALSYYEKVAALRGDTLPPTHPDVLDTEKHIRRLLSQLK